MAIEMTTGLAVGFLSLVFLFLWRSFLLSPSLKLPPGPRPLPIVGNWLLLRKFGNLIDCAAELNRRYGPIVTLWIGYRPVIIISGPEMIQEAMITNGSVFMARMQYESTKILKDNHRVLSTGEGERHQFLRKLMVSKALTNKKLTEYRPIRDEVVDLLVDTLKKELRDNGGIVSNFRLIIRSSACNLIAGILFGKLLTLKEYQDLDFVILEGLQVGGGKPRDFVRWLKWLPDRAGVKFQREARKRISDAVQPLIQERAQVLESGKADQPAYVDILLAMRDGKIPSQIEILDSDVELMCIEIITAALDTTALNMEFCIANLINHQETQEKLAQEISAVVGERAVNEDDIPQLPYLRAVVQESLRRHPPSRMAPSRRALSATKVAGYDIPVNAAVMQFIEAVSLSPEIWEDPLRFWPERFVNKTVDLTGSTEVTMIPFGVGRRMCPGMTVATLHAQVILPRLIQKFQWKPATPGKLLDVTAGYGLTGPMMYPLVASVQERVTVS